MAFALLLFVVLLIVGRTQLGIKGIAICLAIAAVFITIVTMSNLPLVLLAAMAAMLDVGLVLFLFGGDIPLRPKR